MFENELSNLDPTVRLIRLILLFPFWFSHLF